MREYQIVDGRYRLERRIAAGGFGAIYLATDVVMGREVALKVLHRELADDAAVVARFRREADALARLRDPHTITMYDVGHSVADGMHYIVLELLRGESLHAQFLTYGAMPWRRVAQIARGVCSSLGEAHAAGIVHRDLKPANIHLESSALAQDFVKVLDFGIAKMVDADTTAFPDLTLAGQMIGTFDYMPPEQLIGGPCSGRTDVFALAVVMYEMISGERPFGEAQGPASRLMTMLSTVPASLAERASVPPELDAIVMRALSRELDDRPDIAELDAVLARLIEESAVIKRVAPEVVPSDISAMIDEALDDSVDDSVDVPGGPALAHGSVDAALDDDDDTWVGEIPQPTVIGLPPTRAPSQPVAPHNATSGTRPTTTRFAVGSRTELPPAKGLWSRDAEGSRTDQRAVRPAPIASLSMPTEAKPPGVTRADNSATRRPTPVGLAPRPTADSGTTDVRTTLRPTPVGLGSPGPRRQAARPVPVASMSMPASRAANDGASRTANDGASRMANDASSQAITARQAARTSNPRTIVPAPIPRLPVVAFAPVHSRPTPSEMALPPAPMFPMPVAFDAAGIPTPFDAPLPVRMPTGTSQVQKPPSAVRTTLRYMAWTVALFGVGFAAAVGLSHL